MTKFVSDNWMEAKLLKSCQNTQNHWWWNHPVLELKLPKPLSITANSTCRQALDLMKLKSCNQAAVTDGDGSLQGVFTVSHATNMLVAGRVKLEDAVGRIVSKKFLRVHLRAHLGLVSRMLEKEDFVVVVTGMRV